MALTVTLEFSDDELDYFRSQLRRIRARNGHRTPAEIAAAASAEVARLRATARSPFVLRRIDRVDRLIAMLEDPEWQLPEPERRGVLDGLAYVADAHDLVPDSVPVFGLADDAIVLELLLRELQHELDGYEEFDAFRRDEARLREAVAKSGVDGVLITRTGVEESASTSVSGGTVVTGTGMVGMYGYYSGVWQAAQVAQNSRYSFNRDRPQTPANGSAASPVTCARDLAPCF